MARQYKTGLIITGDASGGIKAMRATDKELGQLNKGFERGSRRAKDFANNSKGVSRELEFLKGTAMGVGTALAGAFAVSNLRGQAQLIAETDALAKSIGVATSELQAWDYAGRQVGLGAGKIGDIFKDVSDKLGDFVATGGGEAADLFENLNLNIAELRRLSPDQQLLKIGEALSQIDPGQRVFYLESIANDASRLLPLLENNAAGLREFTREAESLGVAMDQVDIDNAVAANQAMIQLGGTMQGLTNQVVSDLGPGFSSAADSLTDMIREAGGAEAILERVGDVAGTLATVYLARRLGPTLLTVGAQGLVAGRNIAAGLAIAAGATGPLNRALIITQGRIAATAAAGRAMTASLALIGGPAGAAILAGAAIYTFRDELGLTLPQIDANSEAVHQLTGELDDLSRAEAHLTLTRLVGQLAEAKAAAEGASEALQAASQPETSSGGGGGILGVSASEITRQTEAIGEISEAGQESRQEIVNLEAAIGVVEGRLSQLGETSERTAPTITKVGDAAKELAKTYKQQAGGLAQQIALFGETGEAAKLRYEMEHGSLKALAPGKQEYLLQLAEELDGLNAAKEEAEKYQKQTESLIQQYDQQYQKVAQLHDAVDQLNRAYNDPDVEMSFAQYQRMLAAIRDEMQQLAIDADPMAQEMARAWEEASKRIDETFADAFAGAFDSFDDFGDQLLDGFKRLLAELAYQATLKPIVVSITGQMGGALGIPGAGGQGGGMGGSGGLLSAGKNLWNSAQQGFGNIAWAGAPTSYSGGFAGSATSGMGTASAGGSYFGGSTANFSGATGLASLGAGYAGGYVGSEVGGMVSDKQANSNYGQMAGTAIGTYFGGPIGAGIGAALGSLADTLFGSGGSDLDIAMQRLPSNTAGDAGRWDHGIVADGGLGAVGFHEANSREVKDLWDVDEAQKVVDTIAEMDSLIAGMAQNAGELGEMQRIAQGYYGETSNPGDVVDRLTGRYDEVFEALGGGFGEFVRGLEGGIGDIVEQAVAGRQAFALMSQSAERLNLNIKTSGVAAYEASSQLAQLAGGVDNLASAQQGYYQAFFSDAERAAHLQDDLAESLNAMGLALPGSREGFRALVEAQNLNTAAGRRMYLQLLELAPAFDELADTMTDGLAQAIEDARSLADQARDTVRDAWGGFERDSLRLQSSLMELAGDELGVLNMQREQELAAMDAALRPFQERVWSLQDEAQAMADYQRELQRAESQLGSTLDQIRRFVDEARATGGTPSQNLDESRAQFQDQLALAQGGDRGALQSITQYADRFMQSGQDYFASGEGFQAIQQQVLGALEALPDQLTAEEFIADEIREALKDTETGIAAHLAELGIDVTGELGRDLDTLNQALGGQLDSLASAALDELAELQGLHDETQRQVSQLVSIDSSVLSVRDAVQALGVAQEEIARIERERQQAEKAEQQRLADDRQRAAQQAQAQERRGDLSEVISSSQARIERNNPLAQQYAERADQSRQGYWSDSYVDHLDQQAQSSAGDWDAMRAFYQELKAKGNLDSANHFYNLSREYAYGNSVAESEARIKQARQELASLPKFAKGGAFTGSVVSDPTLFDMGLMGEAGPEAIMPLASGPGGKLGVSVYGDTGPVIPNNPLLGQNDVAEVLRDLKNEVAHLRRENREMQQQISGHTANTANAVANAGRQSAQQREQMIEEQRAATRAARVKGRTV